MVGCGSIVQFFFFFQAEDGIRDKLVTGVQTCALPIFNAHRSGGRLRGQAMREPDQGIELARRRTGVDRLRGEADPFLEVAGLGPGHQGRRRVHQHDVAARSRLAREDAADDPGVLLTIAPLQVGDGGARHAEVLRAHPRGPDHALVHLRDVALAGVGDLVEAVRSVDDEGPDRAQLGQHPGERLGQAGRVHPDHLGGGDVEGAGGVAAGAAGIDQHLAVGAGLGHQVRVVGPHLHRLLPHHLGEADQLLDRLGLHAERGQEGGDLGVGGRARHDRFHGRRGLDPAQVAPVDEGAERLGDDRTGHAAPASPARARPARWIVAIARSTSLIWSGFDRTRSTPLVRSSAGSTSTPNPLIITTPTSGVLAFTARATCHPVMPGIARSVKTRSNDSAEKRSTAACPLPAITATWPAVVRMSATTSATSSSSSTTRQRRTTEESLAGAGSAAASATWSDGGKTSRNVVPRPSSLSTVMRPLWRARIPYAIDRPRPVPFGPLVVKNGSKIFCRIGSGMPMPVSVTSTMTCPSGLLVRRVSCPPLGMASTALSTRLVKASRSSAGSPAIFGRCSARSVRTSISTPRRRASCRQVDSVASSTCCTTWFSSTATAGWARPRIDASTLLKSWATPEAISPRARSFSVRTS